MQVFNWFTCTIKYQNKLNSSTRNHYHRRRNLYFYFVGLHLNKITLNLNNMLRNYKRSKCTQSNIYQVPTSYNQSIGIIKHFNYLKPNKYLRCYKIIKTIK